MHDFMVQNSNRTVTRRVVVTLWASVEKKRVRRRKKNPKTHERERPCRRPVMLARDATRVIKRHMQTHGTRTETLTTRVTIFRKEERFLSPLRAAFKCCSGFVSCRIKDWHHLLYIFIYLYLTHQHTDCISLVKLKNVFKISQFSEN